MVALQSRLNAPQPAESLPLDAPEQPKPKKQPRIKLKPLEEDFPPVEPPHIADETEKAAPLSLLPTLATEAVSEPITTYPEAVSRADDSALGLLDELALNVEPLNLTADMAPIDPDAEIKAFTPETLIPQNEDTLRPAAPPLDLSLIHI